MAFKVRLLETELTGVLGQENRHRLERVMRLRPGDVFVITDGCGNEAEAVLEENGHYSAASWFRPQREATRAVTLFAALTKGEKFDWLVEKAVELGVARIVPVISRHCVVKKTSDAKSGRWQKIALSAMLQCGGCVLPKIDEPMVFDKIPQAAADPAVVLYEQPFKEHDEDFSRCRQASACWVLTGPEGGFAPEEIASLEGKGWQSIYLGQRIFRAETAPLIALSAILTGSWSKAGS